MRKLILFLFMVLVISFGGSAIEKDFTSTYANRTQVIDSAMLDIVSMKYEPYPVEPGEYFTLWIKVRNLGNMRAEDASIEFVESYPFKIDREPVQKIGLLDPGQEFLVKYEKIRVAEDAIEGENEIEFNLYPLSGYPEYKTKKIKITVQEVSPIMSIEVSSEPEKIPQGGVANVNINLRNLDTSLLQDIGVKLELPDEFVPVGSTVDKKISKLKPGEENTISFDLMVDADAVSKAYKVSFALTYYDEVGNRYVKNDTFGLLVGKDIEYLLNVDKSDVLSVNNKGNIVLSISNTGPSNIRFLSMKLLPSKNYAVLSNEEIYLGNLESDDFDTAEFEIYLTKGKEEIPLMVQLSYKDGYNKDFVDVKEVPLRIYSSFELSRYGLVKKGALGSLIFYIIIALLIYYTYKGWKERRDIGLALRYAVKRLAILFIKIIKFFRWRNLKRLPRRIRMFFRSV